MFGLLVKMLYILVLCRVLLIAGVQTLTIDSQLGTSIEDCFERISIGEHLPADAIYRNVSELTNRECEQICKQDKQCQAYDYGVGAKGNATCNLSTLDEKTIKEQNPLKRHPDYDVYTRRFQCEQSPPSPIQPLSDDPGGPLHRPVFRPEIDDRPSEDYLISGDIYGKPQPYRPDDATNSKPDFDAGPSYGDHKPQDIPYKPRPERPNDSYRPERPNDAYRPQRPHDLQYRPNRPNDLTYGPNRPNDPPYGSSIQNDAPYGSNIQNDLPYGSNRPNDPSYGSNRPNDSPYGSNRPNDPPPYGSNRPNDPPYGSNTPNDPPPYGSNRPNDSPYGANRPDPPYGSDIQNDSPYGSNSPNDLPYGPTRPNNPPYRPNKPLQRPESNDVLQFQDINKPKPQADENIRPYGTEKPNYHYIIRPNRKPTPQNDYTSYGHPSGPIGPPSRPYKPTRPYDKPTYTYHDQYASSYGQNSQNDNTVYVEIHDPPRPYIPIKDRPNQQYNGQGYLGYGTYSSQNSYSQSQNSQYISSITEIGGYGQNSEKPGYKPYDRPQKPVYQGVTSQRPNDYEKPYGNQGGYGNQEYGSYQPSYNNNKGSSGNKGSYNQDYSNQYGSNRPTNDYSNYGETGYGQTQRPNNKPNDHGSYGNQNSYKGSYSSSSTENSSHQSSYNNYGSYESHKPSHGPIGGYSKPEKPHKPYDSQNSYGSNQGGYSNNQDGYGSNQGGYGSNHGSYGGNHAGYESSQSGYGSNQESHSTQSSYGYPSYGNNQGNYGLSYGNQGSNNYGQNKPSNTGDSGYGNTQGYGSIQGGFGSNQESYGSDQGNYGSNQGGYGSNQGGYSNNQGGYGSNQGGYSNNQGGYGSDQGSYGSNQEGYGMQTSHVSQGGYGFSSTSHGYGTAQSHGETQYADHSSYSGYGNRPTQKPVYGNNRPDYDYERPGHGQKPGPYQKPDHDPTGYGQKPSYDSQTTGYGQTPGYDDAKPGYNDIKPGYNDAKPGHNDAKPGNNDAKPGYNDAKPADYDKPDPPYLDVKPVYEYDMDKPNNVPAYIAKPSGEVVASRPVVIGDYGERPVYKEPGVPRKDVSYKACFRRVLAGQRALRSFVRRVATCERLEDCRRECAEERRFHCESFNYKLDPSFRGKGLCELMTKPIEAFNVRRDFVQDKDYDFYEIDRNSLEPNCPETLRGPGLLHSGFLSSKDRIDRPNRLDHDRNRPNRLDDRNQNRVDGWRDRNDWVGGRGDAFSHEGHKGRYEDRFVPYQIDAGKPDDDQRNWGQYGGLYGGSQYYKNRNEYTKSISHWGLTSERPTYGVKPYENDHRNYHEKDLNNFDYYSLGKNLRKYFESPKDENHYDTSSNGHRHDAIDYHMDRNDDHRNSFVYHTKHDHSYHSGKEDHSHAFGKDDNLQIDEGPSGDFYGVGKGLHRYGHGAWKKGRWNVSGSTNGIDDDVPKTYYDASDRSDDSTGKDCFSRRRPGMSLNTGAIRRSLVARSVVACEAACFGEKEFKCVSYSYRYSNSRGSDNCFLSERPFHGLDLSADSGSDVYAMPQLQGCSTASHTPWIESECFYHVRSDTAVSGGAVQAGLTVAGLGACEAECIRAQGFFCRGFSFRFDSPTIGEELHNCILTSSATASLHGEGARRAGGHELYARGNYGRGCEPHATDVKDNGECYLQYDKAAKLTPSATRGRARVKDEQSCSNACTEAPFRCLSFSYNNNAPPDSENCLLSEIRLFDLQRDVDYVHSGDDWLFAFDLFNSKCWRRVHSDEPSSEIPHPIHTSSEEDFPSGPTGSGYLPDSGPSGPPSGPPESYVPGSSPPTGPSYHPQSGPEYKPYPPPSGLEKPYPVDPYKPSNYPSYKPGESYPGQKPGYGSPEDHKPGYRPEEPYRPSYRPEEPSRPGYRPEEPSRPGYRPDETYRPSYRPDQPNRPSYKPLENEGQIPYRPGFRPTPRPDYRPTSRPDLPGPYRTGLRPSEPYPGKPVDSGFRPGQQPGYGSIPGYLPKRRPAERPERPIHQGDREGGPLEVPWRHYTVSGFPCRAGTTCAQNHIVGHWACEPEGGEIGSWDYCCAPSHRCGYSEGFHKPWCYVGPKEDQWRPCSEKYYPYHQHNVPHPSSQGHRDDNPPRGPWHDRPQAAGEPPRPAPGPSLSPSDQQYWDDLYRDGPRAYYDKYGNPLPGYSRVPTENRPRIRNRYNPSRPSSGNWVPVSHEEPTGVPGSLGAPRYWPVAYLHKDPPPNTTYFRYNETRSTTTEKTKTERTTLPPLPPLSRELPETEKPIDLEAKSTRDDKKINISKTDEVFNIDVNDTVKTTTEIIVEKELNVSDTESTKTENYKDLDKISGIDDKLDDFSKSIEVFDIEDAKDDKSSDLKMLEAEEKQIEAIGRLLAARRGTKLVLEKRSQKDLETKNIAIDKDLVDFNFGNRFPTSRPERRGVIKRISKDEIERDRNLDRSLEVSETTYVRPPRVLSTTENIRKAIVNGKVFYDATIREQRDVFENSTKKQNRDDMSFVPSNNFKEQRDIYLNSSRKPKHLRQEETKANITSNITRRAKYLRPIEDPTFSNIKYLREERDTRQNNTRKIKRRQDDSSTITVISSVNKDLYTNSSRKPKNLRRLEETSTPSVIANNNFGKRKVLIPRNINPVRRVRRVYRKRYNPEEVRKRLLERERNKNSTELSIKI